MKGFYILALLILSNIFMTLAWYGHLKFSFLKGFEKLNLPLIILISWGIAFFEYCIHQFVELKVIQEVISLIVFAVFSVLLFRNESFRWNHLAGFICLILAVYFIFKK